MTLPLGSTITMSPANRIIKPILALHTHGVRLHPVGQATSVMLNEVRGVRKRRTSRLTIVGIIIRRYFLLYAGLATKISLGA